MRTWRWQAAAACLCAALVVTGCTTDAAPAQDTPGRPAASQPSPEETAGATEWPAAAPASLGLDGRALRRLAREARRARSSCYAVARDGSIAGEWNWHLDADQPRQVFSITKSVTSALVGIAVGDGDLRLDDRVSRYVPSWRGTPAAKVTVRNLLAGDSGRFWSLQSDYTDLLRAPDRTAYAIALPQQFAPGTTWSYNNAAIQVLEAVLSRATGTPVGELAEERLFAPLGMEDSSLGTSGTDAGAPVFFGMQTTCRDLLRFGQLYLDEGRVDGEQLLPRSFVRASVGRSSTELNAAYGLLWWLNRPGLLRGPTDAINPSGEPLEPVRGQLAPEAPDDVFAALGLGGQVLLVDPGSGTLVVRLSRDLRRMDSYGFPDAARVITTALR